MINSNAKNFFDIAIIMTAFNEQDNVYPVLQELYHYIYKLPYIQVIIVNDGSDDLTLKNLYKIKKDFFSNLIIISHEKRIGKSAALRTGILNTKAPWIATMDADGQDDPKNLLSMWNILNNNDSSFIVGIRKNRQDTLSKKIATFLANKIRAFFLKDGCPDTGAPLKIFPRNRFLLLPYFDGMHRFLPALLQIYKLKPIYFKTQHRSRISGKSKYNNLHRAIFGFFDLIFVIWLKKRTHISSKILNN